METLLLATLTPVVYFTGLILYSRWAYRHDPFTGKREEPSEPGLCLFMGLTWPFFLLISLVFMLVSGGLLALVTMPSRRERHEMEEGQQPGRSRLEGTYRRIH
jgi:hypothetical protein